MGSTQDATADAARPRKLEYHLYLAVAIGLTAALMLLSRRGLGLWDEIYYVQWIAAPDRFDAMVQPFGLLLHPIYLLFDRSVVAMRIIGILLVGGSGAVLGIYLRDYYATRKTKVAMDHLPQVGIVGGFLYYVLWILTPSYNLLANAGGALIMAGALGWITALTRRGGGDAITSMLVGLGGALAFFGKPTFATIAAVAVAILMVLIGVRAPAATLRKAAITGATALLILLVPICSAMPLDVFVERIRNGTDAFSADYSLVGLVTKTMKDVVRAGPAFLFSLAGLMMALAVTFSRRAREFGLPVARWGNLAIAIANLLLVTWMLWRAIPTAQNPWSAGIGAPVIGLAIAQLGWCLTFRPDPALFLSRLGPVLVLMAIPFATAFGTANDFTSQAGMSLYPVLLAAVIAGRLSLRASLARWVESGWLTLSVALLIWSVVIPYNLPAAIAAQTVPARLPFTTDVLLLDRFTAGYAVSLRQVALREGITPDTPVLDLSGVAPGTAVLLNARAPYFPWIIPFSLEPGRLAAATWLSMSDDDRRRTWIIGPVDPRFLKDPMIVELVHQGRYAPRASVTYTLRPDRPPVVLWKPAPLSSR